MKFLPLVWAAWWRKPGEALLIFLAVTAAFTLFGLMLGLHTTYRRIVDNSRMDRLFVDKRFTISDGPRMPIAMRAKIARMPGVAAVGLYDPLNGYYQNPHNFGRITAVDQEMRLAWSELLPNRTQWQRLFSTPTGVLVSRKMAQKWRLREGDTLPFITQPRARADGSSAWEFHVLAIVPDDPTKVGGFILGNYEYIDNLRPLPDRGLTMEFRVALADAAQANQISLAIDQTFANSATPTITIPQQEDYQNAFRTGISAASVTWPVAGAGLFMILLVTANGIAQSVRQRSTEFAVLSALGFRGTTISALVFMEAVLPCLLGALAGTTIAAALALWPARYLPADLTNAPKPTVAPIVVAWSIGFALALALASSTAPVLRLRRLSVAAGLAGQA